MICRLSLVILVYGFRVTDNYYFHIYDLLHHIFIVIPSGFIDLHISSFAQNVLGYPVRLGGPVALGLVHVGSHDASHQDQCHLSTSDPIYIFIASHIAQIQKHASEPQRDLKE